jgi:glycosyltransferase involved in cell wall biosynthesis
MVSIIVPVYNVEPYLRRCVDSLVAQTYKDIEIILVDDGSPDDCPRICDEYARAYSNIKVIHKANGGLSSARLAGFREATGEYIQFVDSDDFINSTMTEEMVNAITAHHAELAICGHRVVHGESTSETLLPYTTDVLTGAETIRQQYVLPLFGHDNMGPNIPGFACIRLHSHKLLTEDMFLSERKYFLEDHILDLLYADHLQTIAVVNKPLYNYCVNSASLSNCRRSNKWEMESALLQWYRQYIGDRHIAGAERRLNNFCRGSIVGTVDNAVKTESYVAFRDEMNRLFQRDDFRKTLSTLQVRRSADSQNLTVMLLKLRMLRLLYKIRKSRIEKAQTR